jgi:hypothetical protein
MISFNDMLQATTHETFGLTTKMTLRQLMFCSTQLSQWQKVGTKN